jgi:tetratricopeptide (TPR) repeat protein
MRPWFQIALVVLALGGAAPSRAQPACTMAQLQADAASVIAPCNDTLADPGLSDADRSQALFVRGRAHHRTKNLMMAAGDYRAAFALNPKNEEILVSWSNVDLRERRMKDYVQRLDLAYRLNPKNAHVLRSIGAMHWNFGRRDKALEFYASALEVDPKEAFALYFRAEVYRWERNFAAALADVNALLAIPREEINAQGFLDEKGVMRDFHVKALIQRAYNYEGLGRFDLAEKDYDAAVESGRSAPALAARAHFLAFERNRKDEALRDLMEAVRTEPTFASAHYSHGALLMALGRFEEALAAFDATLKLEPAYTSALTMRARAHRELGHTDAAVQDLHASVVQNPRKFHQLMNTLRRAGYWTVADNPRDVTPALADAMRACMIDTNCN